MDKLIARDLVYRAVHQDLIGFNVQKLKGRIDIYRVRKGRVRVIYRNQNGVVEILDVGLRDDKTYKNL